MGASASIQLITNIYVSYDERDVQGFKYIQRVCDILEKQNTFKHNKYQIVSNSSTATELERAIDNSSCIIICISSYTQCSYTQNLELQIATKPKYNKKILYIITSEKFNPRENPETKAIIGNQKWKPLYNEKYITELTTDILLQYG